MEPAFVEKRIAIVGLGLMGGSLAAALSAHAGCRQVIGIARRRSTITTALDLRFIQHGTTDLAEGVREADVVILATPARDILEKIAAIGPWLKQGCLLLDVGSTKARICAAMQDLPAHVQPVGGHPMCGKETSGLAMADPSLYRDKVFVLCPLARTSPQALSQAQTLVKSVGARALVLDPERHDRLVAAISHLPYLLSVALMRAAEAFAAQDDLLWKLAASGFRDTSRLAAGDITMMLDILMTNREPILETVRRAQHELGALAELLEQGDMARLEAALREARNRRMEVYR